MTDKLHPRRAAHTSYRQVGEEGALVVNVDRSVVQVLNPVGSKIYSLLDGQHTTEQIIQAVMDEFEVSREQAERDLQGFLSECDREGLLESRTEQG